MTPCRACALNLGRWFLVVLLALVSLLLLACDAVGLVQAVRSMGLHS